ncbi:nucleotide exchange factor GrpE [Rhodothermus marinus]|uniref:nucleotide exchange factor GrpE n=1 Tax=Rhodothermus marinus TaxID=29549 RepID=UPI001D8C2FCA|nr:nucleotide exchange factor GrpE [Rhodothermus marinus]MBO2490648.1 nucleotide exchange factor GrpE [Rhodothermus marinus]
MAEEMKTTPNEEQVNETKNTPTPEAEAAAAEVPAEEENDLVARIEQLEAELAQVQDKFLRTAAELQNYRRRVEQEKRQLLEMGKALAIRPLLEVLDDLERSLEAARQAETQDPGVAYYKLREGVELVHQKFLTELARLGVEPIEAMGQPFDPALHEAMMQQPAPEGVTPGTVLQEVQKGYRMGERVLRHSRVVVAAPPDGNSQA